MCILLTALEVAGLVLHQPVDQVQVCLIHLILEPTLEEPQELGHVLSMVEGPRRVSRNNGVS